MSHILEIGKEQIQVINFGYLFDKLWNVFEKEFWIFIVKNVEIDAVSAACNKCGTVVQANDYALAYVIWSCFSHHLRFHIFTNTGQNECTRTNSFQITTGHLYSSRCEYAKNMKKKDLSYLQYKVRLQLGCQHNACTTFHSAICFIMCTWFIICNLEL